MENEITKSKAYGMGVQAAIRNEFDESLFSDNAELTDFYCAGYRDTKHDDIINLAA